jgi:hypothetical protein
MDFSLGEFIVFFLMDANPGAASSSCLIFVASRL